MSFERDSVFNERGQLNCRLVERIRDYAYRRTRAIATYDGTVESGSSGTLIVPSATAQEASATLATCSVAVEYDDYLLVLPFTFTADAPQEYDPDLGMLEI